MLKNNDLVIVACNTFITTSKRNFKCTGFRFCHTMHSMRITEKTTTTRENERNMSNNLLFVEKLSLKRARAPHKTRANTMQTASKMHLDAFNGLCRLKIERVREIEQNDV